MSLENDLEVGGRGNDGSMDDFSLEIPSGHFWSIWKMHSDAKLFYLPSSVMPTVESVNPKFSS